MVEQLNSQITIDELSEEELEEMNNALLEQQFKQELIANEEEDLYPTIPLLNKISRDKLDSFGGFLKELANKVGPKNPVKIGESYSNLIITPLGVATLCGHRLRPQDQFGIRLWELLELLTTDINTRDLEFKKRLVWEVNRAKGALREFGKTSVAKKFSQSGRVATLLVNRSSEDINPHLVLINPVDSKEYKLNEGDLVIIGRYPGSSFSTHMVLLNTLVPQGTAYTSTKALLSHQGDDDGDMILLIKVKS